MDAWSLALRKQPKSRDTPAIWCRVSIRVDMGEEQKVRSLLIADVRDVAAAHLAARRAKPGQRFIVSTEASSLCCESRSAWSATCHDRYAPCQKKWLKCHGCTSRIVCDSHLPYCLFEVLEGDKSDVFTASSLLLFNITYCL